MQKEYLSPDFEIIKYSFQRDVLSVSNPEYSIPEEGGDLPRSSVPEEDDLFG